MNKSSKIKKWKDTKYQEFARACGFMLPEITDEELNALVVKERYKRSNGKVTTRMMSKEERLKLCDKTIGFMDKVWEKMGFNVDRG